MNEEFIFYLRELQASTSVGPSTARRMGPKGTVKAAREHLKTIDIRRFSKWNYSSFLAELDKVTEELRCGLPRTARNWGSARKFLNIFLRGCTYNKYLCKHYRLDAIEPWLEVPMDSYTAKRLRALAGRGNLPRWKGVIHLTPSQNSEFQEFAWLPARLAGVNRVDLDVEYWRREV